MTTMAPEEVNESLDPRDPLLRLSTFFDDGTVELLHERDRSGVLAAAGSVNGVRRDTREELTTVVGARAARAIIDHFAQAV